MMKRIYTLILLLITVTSSVKAQLSLPKFNTYDIPTAVVDDSVFNVLQKIFVGQKFVIKEYEPKGTILKCVSLDRLPKSIFMKQRSLPGMKFGYIKLRLMAPDSTVYIYDLSLIVSGLAWTGEQAKYYETKFGKHKWVNLLKEELEIGMTMEMALIAWGEPESKSKTTTQSGVTELWIYSDNVYLKFTNGLITSITE